MKIFSSTESETIVWNPTPSMNKTWMDECAARLKPMVDQYPDNTKLSDRKISRLNRITTRSCPGDKKIVINGSVKPTSTQYIMLNNIFTIPRLYHVDYKSISGLI